MSKALQKAAIVVGAIALVATGVGVAAGAGLFGTGLGAASAQVVAFTVAKYATFAAAGLSAAGTLLAQKPTFDTATSGTEWRADPYAGLPYAMGETAVGGQIVYRRTDDAWAGGDENDLQTIVTVLSCAGPIQAIDGVDIDRTSTSFDGTTGAASGALADYVWWKGQLGATPESAQLNIVAGSSSAPAGWTSAHKLSGLAADMVRLRYDSKGDRFGLGEPQKRVRGRWVKVYDPRLDSTYPGGSGSCRPFNESTYVFSRNPHLHALTWAMGRYSNGKLVAGLGLALGNILVDQFIEGANICDANGWNCDGVIFTRPQTAWNNLKLILASAAAVPYITGGRVGCRNQTPRVAVGSITRGDLRGEASRPATRPRRERKNIAFYRFRSVANEYEVIDAGAPVRIADYVTDDVGEERPTTVELPLVQNITQAAVVAAYEIAESREASPLTYSVGPRFYNFKPGDCITDDTPEGGGQLLRIEQRAMDPESQIVTLICRTETTSKHARALAIGGTAPATITPPAVPGGPAAPSAGAWSATGTAITDSGGAIPALVISGAADNAAATEILFWYRPTGGDGVWRAAGTGAPTATRHEITAVTPGTQYDVGISYRVRGLIGARRVLGPVTAGSPTLVWANVSGTGRPEDNATRNEDTAGNAIPTADSLSGAIFSGGANLVTVSGQKMGAVLGSVGALCLFSDYRPVRGGERIYFEITAHSDVSTPDAMQLAYNWIDASGGISAVSLPDMGFTGTEAIGIGATKTKGMWITMPASAVGARMYARRSTWTSVGTFLVRRPFQGRHQPAADVTAQQPVVSRLDPATGRALASFQPTPGNGVFTRLVLQGAARNGDVVTFPFVLNSTPEIRTRYAGVGATAGQNIVVRAAAVTTSGFTMRAVSQAVSAGSTVTDGSPTAGGSGEPQFIINRSNGGSVWNDNFQYQYQVYLGSSGTPVQIGSCVLAFFARQGGAWVEIYRGLAGVDDGPLTITRPFFGVPIDFGSGSEFGISLISSDVPGATLVFVNVTYRLATVTETDLSPSASAEPVPWEAFL